MRSCLRRGRGNAVPTVSGNRDRRASQPGVAERLRGRPAATSAFRRTSRRRPDRSCRRSRGCGRSGLTAVAEASAWPARTRPGMPRLASIAAAALRVSAQPPQPQPRTRTRAVLCSARDGGERQLAARPASCAERAEGGVQHQVAEGRPAAPRRELESLPARSPGGPSPIVSTPPPLTGQVDDAGPSAAGFAARSFAPFVAQRASATRGRARRVTLPSPAALRRSPARSRPSAEHGARGTSGLGDALSDVHRYAQPSSSAKRRGSFEQMPSTPRSTRRRIFDRSSTVQAISSTPASFVIRARRAVTSGW